MPIELPQLDDITFDRTVAELERRIAVYAPEWTDRNASDPGIALIQLFAYLAEQVGWRLNRVPESAQVELLKILGVRLQPAHAASTMLALLLTDPTTLAGYTLAAGARVRAKVGTPPPSYETDDPIDVVPAEPVLLATTKNPFIHDVLATESGRETPAVYPQVPANDTEWLTVTWDGKTPKLKDVPLDPVRLVGRAAQRYLWIGLAANLAADAGFRGARVTLSVSFDDDERPDLAADERCGTAVAAGETPVPIDWLAYYDAPAGAMRQISGRIDDTTARFTRSGTLRFGVPMTVGPIPDASWAPMRAAGTTTPLQACLALGAAMQDQLQPLSPMLTLTETKYREVIQHGIDAAAAQAAATQPPVAHPLDPALRAVTRVHCWLRVALPPGTAATPAMRVRMVTLNAVHATNATTVRNEVLGRGTGRPRQEFALANRNVLAGTLQLAVQESVDAATPLEEWSETDAIEAADPFARVYTLDREAGAIASGDGEHGRIIPLVPGTGDVVALRYRWGGGLAGEVGVGAITVLDSGAAGVAGVVNPTPATGGRDAETLEQAEERVRKEISSRSRAVTAEDFQWIASQTPEVRVARAVVIPLRRPLARTIAAGPGSGTPVPATPPLAMRCGTVPNGPLGIDPRVAAGAVSVVVVPDLPGSEPVPTRSFLRAVCRWLDAHRLVTTEVHVIPPQYCRFCDVQVAVQARPGYTRSKLQDLVGARLARWLHPLTGGDDGAGFPFGGQVHIADLVALVTRTEGVERVESLTAWFTRTPSAATPRQGQLVLCPSQSGQVDRVLLGPEECVSFDATSLTLGTVV